MTADSLFSATTLGSLKLPNRIVMAPMTRLRAHPDGTPTPAMTDYYRQRASAGLIITEGIWPVSTGQSEWRVPGLETGAHQHGWERITAAVHAAGGRIAAQFMHAGRKGHPQVRYDGSHPAGPSAVAERERVHLPAGGSLPAAMPRAMSQHDIDVAITGYAAAARRAVDAGFDLVELHGANSYLIHQFLADNTNRRRDSYGGTITGRIRFAVEVVAAVTAQIGASRVGLRLSPGNPQFDMHEADPDPVYRALLGELRGAGLAYLHLTDNDTYPALATLAPLWAGPVIANVGENRAATARAAAAAALTISGVQAVSFGRGFLVNPDLPYRLRHNLPWNEFRPEYLYTEGAQGYSDYPAHKTSAC